MQAPTKDRQEKAKRLYLDGMTPAEIAKRTGTKHLTVKRWITRYGWTSERDQSKQACISTLCSEMDSVMARELDTAFRLYAAAVEERSAMVEKWIAARRAGLNPDNVLSYTGRYTVASPVERALFCEGIRDICSVIKLAKHEVNKAPSKRQAQRSDNTNHSAPLKVIDGSASSLADTPPCEAVV